MKTIAFFNNKGGVGKTTLVYHVAWMLTELGYKVLAVDLDPQANLSSMFLDDDALEKLWPDQYPHASILSCINPILEGTGDIGAAHIEPISENLHLVAGDLGLSLFEDRLSDSWPRCLDRDKAAFRVMTAFHRIMLNAAGQCNAATVLIDVGPNLGATNRAALIAADHVVMPLAPGLFSLQGLKNLGPTLKIWRQGWKQRLDLKPDGLSISLPKGLMAPAGYIVMQHVARKNRPARAYQQWVEKIPEVYRNAVLNVEGSVSAADEKDSHQIGMIRNYQSLMPLAQDARQPVFLLKPADGAIGAHAQGVQRCYMDFKQLAESILQRTAYHENTQITPCSPGPL